MNKQQELYRELQKIVYDILYSYEHIEGVGIKTQNILREIYKSHNILSLDHDVLSLQDVLRALSKQKYGVNLKNWEEMEWTLYIYEMQTDKTIALSEIDLTLPMQEQSEEVLTNLIELLK